MMKSLVIKKVFNRNLFCFTTSFTKQINNPNVRYFKFGVFVNNDLVRPNNNQINFKQQFSCTSFLFKDDLLKIDENCDEEQDESFSEFVNRTLRIPETGHQVLVIQPFIKWGSSKKLKTTPQLQLSESIALIETLQNWKIVDSKIISLLSFDKKTFFGKGNLELISDIIKSNKTITAVFVSINVLKPLQHRLLEEQFRVPVYDRYTIVMFIFKEHAVTKEAKLQVAMAEIPYLWSRIKGIHEGATDRLGGGTAAIGGQGESFIEVRRRLITEREHKLKESLKKLKTHRELLRNKRTKLEIPVVAVVGYTNAGKTSLIKALTGEKKLEPKNKLFATLDVTVHAGILPSRLEVLFVDTIGFISDIPTGLIESFIATLEDVLLADLIVHVQDVSHPDAIAQNDHVISTLKSLNLSDKLLNNIVNVENKADRLDNTSGASEKLLVSATTGFGLNDLKHEIEKAVLKTTGRICMKIRVKNGGSELSWLYKEATVIDIYVDENNNQFVFADVIITKANLERFKLIFIKNNVKR